MDHLRQIMLKRFSNSECNPPLTFDIQVVADNAWDTIRLLQTYPSGNARNASTYTDLFARHRRQLDSESCSEFRISTVKK